MPTSSLHPSQIHPLHPYQTRVVQAPLRSKIFLEGPAGSGKTTAGVGRLQHLLEAGVSGSSILLLVPQRTLAGPYYDHLQARNAVAGSPVSILTIGGLAQRMVDLFWPAAAEEAGFAHPNQPPVFLTLETAQYYMARIVRPLLEGGCFDGVTIDRNRLYSQILDNLNKAAVVGFPHTEIGERLKSAWIGEPSQFRVYEDAQTGASNFRAYCKTHNLLDFSLQVEVFTHHIWPAPICQNYLQNTYRHLIVDNLEEDTPITHDLLCEWLPAFDSALLIYDHDAGFRSFLGADPDSGYSLRGACDQKVVFEQSFLTSPPLLSLQTHLCQALQPSQPRKRNGKEAAGPDGNPRPALVYQNNRYYPEMLDWVAAQIADLVQNQGLPPSEIAVIAPFLPDALRFSLMNRLQGINLPVRSHRPSRALREEPVTHCLLTLATVAHPQWTDWTAGEGALLLPNSLDIAYALLQAIDGMDLVRAQLLASIVYRTTGGVPHLTSFDRINPAVQERITYRFGERFERLRIWLEEAGQNPPEELDHFLSRLFGEVLSQPGFGFYHNYSGGEVAANLIESVQKYRQVAGQALAEDGIPLGKEYLSMVADGVIAAQYIRSWRAQPDGAVLLAPAYTFLMSNRPVEVQFWLDVGSRGWIERLYQPLTHPYVLSRGWPPQRVWTDQDEVEAAQKSLHRLVTGLLRRCRQKIYLGFSDFSEQGYEERGDLLRAFHRVLQQFPEGREQVDG